MSACVVNVLNFCVLAFELSDSPKGHHQPFTPVRAGRHSAVRQIKRADKIHLVCFDDAHYGLLLWYFKTNYERRP